MKAILFLKEMDGHLAAAKKMIRSIYIGGLYFSDIEGMIHAAG